MGNKDITATEIVILQREDKILLLTFVGYKIFILKLTPTGFILGFVFTFYVSSIQVPWGCHDNINIYIFLKLSNKYFTKN